MSPKTKRINKKTATKVTLNLSSSPFSQFPRIVGPGGVTTPTPASALTIPQVYQEQKPMNWYCLHEGYTWNGVGKRATLTVMLGQQRWIPLCFAFWIRWWLRMAKPWQRMLVTRCLPGCKCLHLDPLKTRHTWYNSWRLVVGKTP